MTNTLGKCRSVVYEQCLRSHLAFPVEAKGVTASDM